MHKEKGAYTFTFNIIDGVIDQTYDCHYGGWEQKGEEQSNSSASGVNQRSIHVT